jgi:hypothetical protein
MCSLPEPVGSAAEDSPVSPELAPQDGPLVGAGLNRELAVRLLRLVIAPAVTQHLNDLRCRNCIGSCSAC